MFKTVWLQCKDMYFQTPLLILSSIANEHEQFYAVIMSCVGFDVTYKGECSVMVKTCRVKNKQIKITFFILISLS